MHLFLFFFFRFIFLMIMCLVTGIMQYFKTYTYKPITPLSFAILSSTFSYVLLVRLRFFFIRSSVSCPLSFFLSLFFRKKVLRTRTITQLQGCNDDPYRSSQLLNNTKIVTGVFIVVFTFFSNFGIKYELKVCRKYPFFIYLNRKNNDILIT